VRNAETMRFEMGPAIRAEHICLESDEFIVAERPRETRVGPALKVASRLRGCETELAFRADHHLAIRTRRRRQPDRDYIVDLRFVESEPVTGRRIAWRCWQATAALVALGVLGSWLDTRVSDPRWQQVGLQASIGLLTAAFCAGLLGWYRTREIIELRSVHGAVRLAEVTGGLGSSRAAETFLAELRRRIEAARSQAAQSKQQFLRDEMREHHRLWNEGVLSDASYDASKRRILQAHA
jgi:hypothetical protein